MDKRHRYLTEDKMHVDNKYMIINIINDQGKAN